MKNIPNWPTTAMSCLNCVHHQYEEAEQEVPNEEEVEVLVCYNFRQEIREPEADARDCQGYYTPNMDIG